MSTAPRAAVMALLIGLILGLVVPGGPARGQGQGAQEVEVVGAYVDRSSSTPILVLRGKRDGRVFPLTIGPTEMTAIAIPLNGVTPPRPLTHDLFLTLFGRLKVSLTRVVITDLRDDIYYAVVHLQTGDGEVTLDSRPSDAIALAIRAKVPVLVEDHVFDKAGAVGPPARPQI